MRMRTVALAHLRARAAPELQHHPELAAAAGGAPRSTTSGPPSPERQSFDSGNSPTGFDDSHEVAGTSLLPLATI